MRADAELQRNINRHFNHSESSVSTNATAPNLAGPGRTLGLLCDFLGKTLEMNVSKLAEKCGLGREESRT